jgi:hypothetical protein
MWAGNFCVKISRFSCIKQCFRDSYNFYCRLLDGENREEPFQHIWQWKMCKVHLLNASLSLTMNETNKVSPSSCLFRQKIHHRARARQPFPTPVITLLKHNCTSPSSQCTSWTLRVLWSNSWFWNHYTHCNTAMYI